VLEKFIAYQDLASKSSQNKRRVCYNISMIKIADRIIELYKNSSSYSPAQAGRSSRSNLEAVSLPVFFTAFMEVLYPYHLNDRALREDLAYIRQIAQKFTPQFNYLLNRKGIGLENYASGYLLELFTGLPMELCYRVWDYLISNTKKSPQTARVISLHTIMRHQ
jgi:hypothetical protein